MQLHMHPDCKDKMFNILQMSNHQMLYNGLLVMQTNEINPT
jgi:hypothetical protein